MSSLRRCLCMKHHGTSTRVQSLNKSGAPSCPPTETEVVCCIVDRPDRAVCSRIHDTHSFCWFSVFQSQIYLAKFLRMGPSFSAGHNLRRGCNYIHYNHSGRKCPPAQRKCNYHCSRSARSCTRSTYQGSLIPRQGLQKWFQDTGLSAAPSSLCAVRSWFPTVHRACRCRLRGSGSGRKSRHNRAYLCKCRSRLLR